MNTPDRPNPIRVAWSVYRARRVSRPAPIGRLSQQSEGRADSAPDRPDQLESERVRNEKLEALLGVLQTDGVAGVAARLGPLHDYTAEASHVDPDEFSVAGAVAYWLNLYNAGAITLAATAFSQGEESVLRVPGGFDQAWVTVAGERLSLDEIEHGKIRRFGDPRIHAALVCGSVSCPTLRNEPYLPDRLNDQLEDQMQRFLADGGAIPDRSANVLSLSRVFLWYGGDFARPNKMPTWLPPRRRWLRDAVCPWLAGDVADWVLRREPKIEFQPYDWSLACTVR